MLVAVACFSSRRELHMQLDDAFPTPWKRVASADHRPLNALEPGAWERASAAAPGLFTNDVHAMTTSGARPQAAAPAANWEAPLANFGSSLDSVASHISSMIGASPHQPSPCASSHQAVHEQGLCPRTMGRVSARRALPSSAGCDRSCSSGASLAQRRSTSRSTTASALANGAPQRP